MSAPDEAGADAAWLSNGTYPASNDTGPSSPELSHRPVDLPTVDERVRGIIDRYEDRVFEPVSTVHGRKLREEVLKEPETVLRTVEIGETEEKIVEETVARGSLPLIVAIQEMLEWYEGYRDKFLRMARGSKVRKDYESFLVDMDNSLTPEYQSTQYARLKALERQFMGGNYPCGRTCEAEFAEPVTVLFGLTASSLDRDGSFRPIADHDREIRDAWSGSSNSVKRTLRYVLEDTLGLSPGEYAWWWQSEPHPGPQKPATGYSHSHPVVIFDAAAIATSTSVATDPETYRPIVAKHVSECDGAGWAAHDLDESVTVRRDDEIQDFASYVSEYLAVAPDQDLLERSDEYLIWAASQWATTTQKYSRSRWATAACKADACQQQYFDEETEQSVQHADSIVPSSKPGLEYECAECGSPHGIDQTEKSLARTRLSQSSPDQDSETEEEPERTLAERWPSARSAGSLGSETRARRCDHLEPDTCPLCATETEAPNHTISGEVPIPESAEAPPAERQRDGFERPPEWEPDAVVQLSTEEETEIGSPGGTAYGKIVVEGVGSIMDTTDLPYLPQPDLLEGPKPWESTTLFDESDVRAGRVPPPELVAREWSETVRANGRVTPKQWSDSWYTERFERQSSPEPELGERERIAIKELVKSTGETSPISIAGQLMLPPSALDEIRLTVKSTI
ncbi:hypothetical protein [Halorubrum sp. BV1]|uniref:hypothetical protein n=1 Tax=Halorubrum sp. BV1 TaxID=1498500 RepID=UPI0006788CDE|nr:hypothetical protein [Halorubrum sp. BV1]